MTNFVQINTDNKIIAGCNCPLFAPTTLITGSITIGSFPYDSTRIELVNLQISGNLTFDNSYTYQYLRHTFSNCEILGSLILPFATVAGGWMYFFDCTFNSAITFNDIPNPIVFTRCNFQGYTITNNLTSANAQYLTYRVRDLQH